MIDSCVYDFAKKEYSSHDSLREILIKIQKLQGYVSCLGIGRKEKIAARNFFTRRKRKKVDLFLLNIFNFMSLMLTFLSLINNIHQVDEQNIIDFHSNYYFP